MQFLNDGVLFIQGKKYSNLRGPMKKGSKSSKAKTERSTKSQL